jgi:hypothetical protein
MNSPSDTMFLPVFKEVLPPANRIPRDDYRYDLLQTIPEKEYEAREDMNYVYLRINDEKDYFITVHIRPKSETDYDEYHGNTQNDSSDSDSIDDYDTSPSFSEMFYGSLMSNPDLMRSYGYSVKPYTFLNNENEANTETQEPAQFAVETPNVVCTGIAQETVEEKPEEEEEEEQETSEEEEEPVVETQVQTFRYTGNRVMWLSGAKVYIK